MMTKMIRGWIQDNEWWPVPTFTSVNDDEADCYNIKRSVEIPEEIVKEWYEARDRFNEACDKLNKFRGGRDD